MNPVPPSLPTLFVPHGAPTFALQAGAAGQALSQTAGELPRPRAVVMISAHWETAEARVGFATQPETIHDFWGFPEPLYAIRYPATGCPEAAAEVLAALRAAGLPAAPDAQRGLDHGAWIPLRLMFPDADVPVIPLSIQSQLSPAYHLQLGRALAPLTRRGFLVIGSGNLTHNLGDFRLARQAGGRVPDYVRAFPEWVWAQLRSADEASLLDYRRLAPAAERAHPSDEHLLPLYVALGAAGPAPAATRLHAGVDVGVIAMDAFAFHSREPA